MLVDGMAIVQSQSYNEIDANHADSSNAVRLECEQIQSGFQSSFKLNHFHKTSDKTAFSQSVCLRLTTQMGDLSKLKIKMKSGVDHL